MAEISNLLRKRKYDNDDEILYHLKDIEYNYRHHTLMERYECSVLQEAIICERSNEIVLKLIELGGRELVMEECSEGKTA